MGLINKDRNGLEEYNLKRKMLITQKEEINKVNKDIDSLKTDVSEIKQLLLKLMDKQ